MYCNSFWYKLRSAAYIQDENEIYIVQNSRASAMVYRTPRQTECVHTLRTLLSCTESHLFFARTKVLPLPQWPPLPLMSKCSISSLIKKSTTNKFLNKKVIPVVIEDPDLSSFVDRVEPVGAIGVQWRKGDGTSLARLERIDWIRSTSMDDGTRCDEEQII